MHVLIYFLFTLRENNYVESLLGYKVVIKLTTELVKKKKKKRTRLLNKWLQVKPTH